ncbi:DUF630 family protein (DUF630 and DUF632) [Rhynchospora pubera]|uniref:DUF630 family protein (DUF630 and DUF632) n=1 Tax=Rhynchospora pubera TaxID=906938 RepID=A0AAV8CWJ1_9POAL|nr:DUF630 family protein (DUF630 and DUF632) [Rhynchospora pubera]
MGLSSSKDDHNTALLLCKGRVRFVKHAIDSRYALSAAQLSYLQSLRNVGQALRQFVEAETSTEPAQSPSHSSYASPSPSPMPDHNSLLNGTPSPFEKNDSVNYMRASGVIPMQVCINLNETHFMQGENSSWDFFDPISRDPARDSSNTNKVDLASLTDEEAELEFSTPIGKAEASDKCRPVNEKGKDEKGEDACQFITHRAKDMVSSMREIEHQFIKAAESGHEVSRMLETRKIRLTISSQTNGKMPQSVVLLPCLICCKANGNIGNESEQDLAKVITWNRSVSSQSSSSMNPLITQSKDETTESGSDFIEEFSMISGSHSSTLDRLYAWERKLYDELRASESLRKAYDQKRTILRQQFARDIDKRAIDKTRATVKDLHSRLMVAIQAVDSISRRIEKLRDDELHPQLVELVQGLTRMWRAMLETYHAQQITISLAYNTKDSKSPTTAEPQAELQKQALIHLLTEVGCLQSTFSNWVKHHKLYVQSLNSWLQNCILQPQERSRGRKLTFSPRRALAPPIFVLLRDWSNSSVTTLSEEAIDSIKLLSSELNETSKHIPEKEVENGEMKSKLGVVQMSLVRFFEQMKKFSESLIKVYENAKEESERAKDAYINGTR